jgi:hypothetical protein
MFRIILVLSTVLCVLTGAAYAQDPSTSSPSPTPTPATTESKTVVYGGMGITSMYQGMDVGGDFCRCVSPRFWMTVEHRANKRLSFAGGTWMQHAFNGKQGADEIDTTGDLTFHIDPSASLRFEAANYKVHRLSVHKLGIQIAKDFHVGKRSFSFDNELKRFTTSKPQLLKGGLVDRMSLVTTFKLPHKLSVTAGPGFGVNNGPFGLGGPAALFFATANIERPLNDHWSFYATGRHSRPLAGETKRRPIYSGEVGMKFHF